MRVVAPAAVSVLFSEPKIPQFANRVADVAGFLGFSALQRAENSSIEVRQRIPKPILRFQCSSASRKFLNSYTRGEMVELPAVSVLFSEPKIPQSRMARLCRRALCVSVLFSEPKIPQSA